MARKEDKGDGTRPRPISMSRCEVPSCTGFNYFSIPTSMNPKISGFQNNGYIQYHQQLQAGVHRVTDQPMRDYRRVK
jgi:hypothetical protein